MYGAGFCGEFFGLKKRIRKHRSAELLYAVVYKTYITLPRTVACSLLYAFMLDTGATFQILISLII